LHPACDVVSSISAAQYLGASSPRFRLYIAILHPFSGIVQSLASFSFGGDIALNELYRAERCRDLAEEYRRIAAMCASTEMRTHYSRISEHYSKLAEAEELGAL